MLINAIQVQGLLTVAAWTIVALWVGALVWTVRGLRRQIPLAVAPPDTRLRRGPVPLVSILVPARNEEHRVLAESIRSMLDQDYPNFEVIAVDDRSTDATGAILHAVARADKRLRVIDGAEPPPDWLGKPHALYQAAGVARGEWLLATDADMIFERAAVRTAVDHAIAGDFDAVTLIPRIECNSFWEWVSVPAFAWSMVMIAPVDRVNDAARPEAMGVGGFFLIHRPALERIGGYRAVKAEVVEDLRTAELLKRSGARLRIEFAPDLVSTRMYSGLGEIWAGFTKNLFAAAEFSLLKVIALLIVEIILVVAPPFVAFVCAVAMLLNVGGGLALSLFVPMLIAWLIDVLIFIMVHDRLDIPVRYALTVPLGHALCAAILANSALRIATGRGVAWKGRTLFASTRGGRTAI